MKITLTAITILMAGALATPSFTLAQTSGGQMPLQSQMHQASPYDAEIQSKLNKEFSNKDKFRRVEATVENGVVTLQGTVDLYAHKRQAGDKARDTDHVQGVRNLIQVAGKTVSDAELRESLANKLRYDRIGYGIVFNALTLNVQNGVVTVGGKVRDEPDKASALAIVENTPGVKGVRDDIEVLPVSIADDELRVRLARYIYNDPSLQKYAIDPQAPIRIVVDRGHVTLLGVVNSEADKNIAGIRAREVPGAFSVDNQLVVANSKKPEVSRKQ